MNPYPNLKILRLQNNFKQEYVSDAIGMSQPEYSKLESGHRKLDAFIIRNLCNLYDISSDVLLGSKASASGNARSSNPHKSPTATTPPPPDYSNNELLMKLMENHSYLLESYLRQQQLQQKMVDKLLKVDHQKDDESDLEQTEM
jgi:transcriptional regulator with XRE-family HTH domain